jgi:hypothetical protein
VPEIPQHKIEAKCSADATGWHVSQHWIRVDGCPSRRGTDGAECERERGHDEDHRVTVWAPWRYLDSDTGEWVSETAPSYPEFWTDEQEEKA